MRARALLVPVAAVALGGVLTEASPADAPARASAAASLVSGSTGTVARVAAHGDDRRFERASADGGAATVRSGEVVASASRSGGSAQAQASAAARTVSVFGGAVTAYGVRRRVQAGRGGHLVTGRVQGLKVDGRMIGTVATGRRYSWDAGTVTVNRGGAGLTVTLTRATGGFPAGSSVTVASVKASARDGAAPGVRATPTPTPAVTPRPAREPRKDPGANASPGKGGGKGRATRRPRPAARRKAPAVPRRLTAQRFAFPVFGSKDPVASTFGAARQIGAHQGNDIFAPFGSPVLAVTDGELFKVGTLPISGNRLWLRSKAGDEFFYAHLSAFSPAAVDGRQVKAGEVLGFTGNTGDAEPTPPHVHFEIHPGGGDAIDPNAILEAWRLKRDVPPGAWLARYGSDTEQRPGALVEVRDFIAGE